MGEQRNHEAAQAVRMAEWNHREVHIVGSDSHAGADLTPVAQHFGMCKPAGAGGAGAAARELDQAKVATPHRAAWGRRIEPVTMPDPRGADHPGGLHQGADRLGGISRHRHSVRKQQTQEHLEPPGAVGLRHHDQTAGQGGRGGKLRAPGRGCRRQFHPRPRQSRVAVDDRQRSRSAADGLMPALIQFVHIAARRSPIQMGGHRVMSRDAAFDGLGSASI